MAEMQLAYSQEAYNSISAVWPNPLNNGDFDGLQFLSACVVISRRRGGGGIEEFDDYRKHESLLGEGSVSSDKARGFLRRAMRVVAKSGVLGVRSW